MGFHRDVYEIYIGFLWVLHEVSMEFLQDFYGISMGFTIDFNGILQTFANGFKIQDYRDLLESLDSRFKILKNSLNPQIQYFKR